MLSPARSKHPSRHPPDLIQPLAKGSAVAFPASKPARRCAEAEAFPALPGPAYQLCRYAISGLARALAGQPNRGASKLDGHKLPPRPVTVLIQRKYTKAGTYPLRLLTPCLKKAVGRQPFLIPWLPLLFPAFAPARAGDARRSTPRCAASVSSAICR